MLDSLSLDGKAVVVTGGGTGLGRAMSMSLARAGADVVVAGRRAGPIEEVSGLIKGLGRRGLAVRTDVTDSDQVAHLLERTLDGLGKADVLINNAGMVGGQGGVPIWEIGDDDWRSVLDANLTGAFYCAKAFARHMVDRGRGKIINVSSGLGLRGGRDNYMYACAKGGVIQLTRSLAVSLGRHGVTSNCIVPGFFPTEGTEASRDVLPRAEFVPMGRVGDPAEIGPVAVFLASAAADYVNGELFTIDGGGLAGGYAPTGHAPEVPLEL
jgi:NAD(P)-dependent dehydrogenase (short-subunit alcohol dehydrogenase family)